MSRPIGACEQYMYYKGVYHSYTNVITVGAYEPELTPQKVYSALEGLLEKECGYCLNTADKGTLMRPVERIQFKDCVEFREVPEFDPGAEISTLHDIYLPLDSETLPLWRLVVFNHRYAAFVADHLLCDGTATVNFHSLFLEQLNLGREENASEFVPPKDVTYHGPLEEYVSTRPPLLYFAKTILPGFLKRFLKPKSLGEFPLKGETLPLKEGLSPSVRTKVAVLEITADKLKTLKKVGKEHGVRLTSALTYFAAKAFQEVVLPANEREAYYDLDVMIPINGRKVADPPVESLSGCFVCAQSILSPTRPLQKSPIDWDYAGAFQTELDRGRAAKEPIYIQGFLKLAGAENLVQKMCGKFSGTHLEVSNVGYFAFPGKSFGIKDFWFSQCTGNSGGYVNVNVIGFARGLKITLSYDTEMPYASRVPAMAKEIVRLVEMVV